MAIASTRTTSLDASFTRIVPANRRARLASRVSAEAPGFLARISQRSRPEFLGEIQGFGADRALVYIDGEDVVDAQLGYSFQSRALDGVSLLFQVNNLTDEPYRQFFNNNGLTQRYEEYGRQYLLGVTYKF